MSIPTFYHSSDAGAPQVTSVSTVGQIVAVLDACLVNGYGAKAAAGWTIEFTDTGIRVYRAGAGNRYFLRVDNSSTNSTFRMNAFSSMTSVNTGAEQFIPTASEPSQLCGISGTAPFAWTVVANNKFFYLYFRALGSNSAGMFYFGDIIPNTTTPQTPLPYGTILGVGGSSSAQLTTAVGATSYGSVSSVATGKFLARNVSNTYVPTGTPAAFLTTAFNHSSISSSTTLGEMSFLSSPDTVSGLNYFERLGIITGNATTINRNNPAHFIGFLPGAYFSPNAIVTTAGIQPVSRLQVTSGPLNGTNLICFRLGNGITSTSNGMFIIAENIPWG
jgi:hypothetical protein